MSFDLPLAEALRDPLFIAGVVALLVAGVYIWKVKSKATQKWSAVLAMAVVMIAFLASTLRHHDTVGWPMLGVALGFSAFIAGLTARYGPMPSSGQMSAMENAAIDDQIDHLTRPNDFMSDAPPAPGPKGRGLR